MTRIPYKKRDRLTKAAYQILESKYAKKDFMPRLALFIKNARALATAQIKRATKEAIER